MAAPCAPGSLYPDYGQALPALHLRLGEIEEGVESATERALTAKHGSSEEKAAVEARCAPKRDLAASIVAACDTLAPEFAKQDASVAAVQGSEAFAALHSLIPVPNGVLKSVQALEKFVASQRQRHTETAQWEAALKEVRAEKQASRESLPEAVAARAEAEGLWRQAVDAALAHLAFSDHFPVCVSWGELRIASLNCLERAPDGVHPALGVLPFLKGQKKHATSQLQRAMLDAAAVQAHADLICGFACDCLRTCDAVCLEEVGQPLATALETLAAAQSLALVVSAAAEAKPGGCEARTAVLARAGHAEPDVTVSARGKSRNFAVLAHPRCDIVAVHVIRVGKDGADIAGAGAALRERARTDRPLLGVGDWNGDVRLLAAPDAHCAVPNAPTTLADELTFPESHGIDAVLVLAPAGAPLPAVEVMAFGQAACDT